MTNRPFTPYRRKVPDFAGDETTELERKLGPLKVVCLVETVSYLALLTVWLGLRSAIGTQIVGSVHGMIFTAFALMMLNIFRPMGWTVKFLAVSILAGPIGALIVYERVRRQGAPAPSGAGPSSGPPRRTMEP